MDNLIEANFGTKMDARRVAASSASKISKKGAFYIFTLRVSQDDIREYSFTNRERARVMREIMISHLEQKIKLKVI